MRDHRPQLVAKRVELLQVLEAGTGELSHLRIDVLQRCVGVVSLDLHLYALSGAEAGGSTAGSQPPSCDRFVSTGAVRSGTAAAICRLWVFALHGGPRPVRGMGRSRGCRCRSACGPIIHSMIAACDIPPPSRPPMPPMPPMPPRSPRSPTTWPPLAAREHRICTDSTLTAWAGVRETG